MINESSFIYYTICMKDLNIENPPIFGKPEYFIGEYRTTMRKTRILQLIRLYFLIKGKKKGERQENHTAKMRKEGIKAKR